MIFYHSLWEIFGVFDASYLVFIFVPVLTMNFATFYFSDKIKSIHQCSHRLLIQCVIHHACTELCFFVRRFLDKFTEFVRLFVNHHLRRFEANPHFPVLEFLSLLFEYTFKQVWHFVCQCSQYEHILLYPRSSNANLLSGGISFRGFMKSKFVFHWFIVQRLW